MLKSGLEHTCDQKSFVYIIHTGRVCLFNPRNGHFNLPHPMQPQGQPGLLSKVCQDFGGGDQENWCAVRPVQWSMGQRRTGEILGRWVTWQKKEYTIIYNNHIQSLRYHHLLTTHYICNISVVFQGPSWVSMWKRSACMHAYIILNNILNSWRCTGSSKWLRKGWRMQPSCSNLRFKSCQCQSFLWNSCHAVHCKHNLWQILMARGGDGARGPQVLEGCCAWAQSQDGSASCTAWQWSIVIYDKSKIYIYIYYLYMGSDIITQQCLFTCKENICMYILLLSVPALVQER